MQKLAYTLTEAAEATGYSERTIRRAIAESRLVAKYENSKPVIMTRDLEAWLEALPSERKTA